MLKESFKVVNNFKNMNLVEFNPSNLQLRSESFIILSNVISAHQMGFLLRSQIDKYKRQEKVDENPRVKGPCKSG